MDILKVFSMYDTNYSINIQGTIENPLFQVNQIGKLLDIKNIRNQTSKLNDTQKVVFKTDTLWKFKTPFKYINYFNRTHHNTNIYVQLNLYFLQIQF